jgi:hypothetical protein
VLVLAAGLFAARLLPEGENRPVAWRDLSVEVGPLEITRSERRLIQERKALARFLARAGFDGTLPEIDFSKRQLLLVSPGPRSSSGYAVDVLDVTEKDEEITVRVREQTPGLGERVDPRVTHPYRLLSLPAGKDVYVDWIGR